MELLGNRLLIKRLPPQITVGGLWLPEIARDDNNTGGPREFLVLQVGTGKRCKGGRRPIEAAPGDRIICHSYTTGPIELADGTQVITDDQILAVILGEREKQDKQ